MGAEKRIKVILFGIGTTGREIAGLILKEDSIQIVGAIARSRHIGKDLGETLGIGKELGVKISNNPDEVFSSTKADLVIHATVAYLPEAWKQISKAVEAGMNVITISGGMLDPDSEIRREIKEKTRNSNASILVVGINPGFAMDYLPLVLSSMCYDVKKIQIERVSDLSSVRASFFSQVGIGMTLEDFNKARTAGTISPGKDYSWASVGSMRIIADTLGWKLEKITVSVEPQIAERSMDGGNIQIEPGMAYAFTIRRTGITNNEKSIIFNVNTGVGSKFTSKNIITIESENAKISESMIVQGDAGTAPLVVNNIKNVIDARPGLLTLKDLPLYKAFEREQY